jgi:hypothetical protein
MAQYTIKTDLTKAERDLEVAKIALAVENHTTTMVDYYKQRIAEQRVTAKELIKQVKALAKLGIIAEEMSLGDSIVLECDTLENIRKIRELLGCTWVVRSKTLASAYILPSGYEGDNWVRIVVETKDKRFSNVCLAYFSQVDDESKCKIVEETRTEKHLVCSA